MTGAADAASELRTTVLTRYDELRHAVSYASAAVLALRGAGDLMDVLRETDRFSLACEALGALAAQMHQSADHALCRAMEDTGAPAFRTAHHTVSTRRTPATVEIADENAVPDECMTTPQPRPDRAKVKAYLAEHPEANWATTCEGGVTLQRRSNRS